MVLISAGLLMYARSRANKPFVFLVHPGGPFFQKKDEGIWSIPKGLLNEGEEPLQAARREFQEEVGIAAEDEFLDLGTVKQKNGKTVYAWAFEKKLFDPEKDYLQINSNMFTMEWPPHSGKRQVFPEVDRGEFFDLETARRKINAAQAEFIDRLAAKLIKDN